MAAFSITLVSDEDTGATWAHTMLNTTIAAARPHVAFSMKSVVLRTPIMAFDDEKFDAKPPPFDSCISTMPIISTEAITMRITNKK